MPLNDLSTEDNKDFQASISDKLDAWEKDFINIIDDMESSRELSLAKTKMEEAVMWVKRHTVKE